MAPCRSQFHQPVFAVPGVQREGLPHKEGGRCRAEADTYPLVDTDHIEDDEQDEESKQTSAEDEEVLSLQAQAKHPAPCRISTVGFQELASEPDLQVSLYPALH